MVFVVAVALVAAIGCTKTAAGPDVGATQTAEALANVQATATAVAIANAAETGLYTFNSLNADQTGDWAAGGALSAVTWNKTIAAGNGGTTGCMQVTSNITAAGTTNGDLKHAFAATDFTGKTITVHINVPASMVDVTNPFGIQLFVQDGTYGWDAFWSNITATGWQTYSWVLPGSLVQDITNIVQVGIQITRGGSSPDAPNATVLIDGINW